VLGSAVSGWLISRVGRKRATWISIGISVVGILPLAFIPAAWWAWLLVGLFGLAYGTYQTVYFALAMGYTDTRIAASMFSILMAVTNVAQGAGMALSGFLADSAFGYAGAFLLLALLNIAAIPFMPLIFGKRQAALQGAV
jgi:PAT family beta-lactamase induction signal transducer AmpG